MLWSTVNFDWTLVCFCTDSFILLGLVCANSCKLKRREDSVAVDKYNLMRCIISLLLGKESSNNNCGDCNTVSDRLKQIDCIDKRYCVCKWRNWINGGMCIADDGHSLRIIELMLRHLLVNQNRSAMLNIAGRSAPLNCIE